MFLSQIALFCDVFMQHSDSHDTNAAWERSASASLPLATAVTRLPSVCIDCLLWTFRTSRIMPFMLFGERLSSLSCAFKSSSALCWRRLFALLFRILFLCVCATSCVPRHRCVGVRAVSVLQLLGGTLLRGCAGKVKSLSHVRLFAAPWTIQSMEFLRPEYRCG